MEKKRTSYNLKKKKVKKKKNNSVNYNSELRQATIFDNNINKTKQKYC